MRELEHKQKLVRGLGRRRETTCVFLRRSGAKAVGADHTSFRLGEAGEGICTVWSLFPPCAFGKSLLETVAETAKDATSGDVGLPAPACSSWNQFRNHQHRDEGFCRAVKSIGRGVLGDTPNINGKIVTAQP
jgi:UDP-N-acetylmuramoylalanine-D-glutamate ligase